MGDLQFGQSLVFAAIQVKVSLSSEHFFAHFFSRSHLSGKCQASLHRKLVEKIKVMEIDGNIYFSNELTRKPFYTDKLLA